MLSGKAVGQISQIFTFKWKGSPWGRKYPPYKFVSYRVIFQEIARNFPKHLLLLISSAVYFLIVSSSHVFTRRFKIYGHWLGTVHAFIGEQVVLKEVSHKEIKK